LREPDFITSQATGRRQTRVDSGHRDLTWTPLADGPATRLTEPYHTRIRPAGSSRTAGVGGGSGHAPGGTSRPARMNPRSFSLTRSRSHCVRGPAPVIAKTAAAGTCSRWPVRTSSSVGAFRRAWPWPSATRVRSRTSMLGGRFQLGDEVAGHAGGQRLAPCEQRDPGGEVGEVRGGLTG
jgi:hypothetical protein